MFSPWLLLLRLLQREMQIPLLLLLLNALALAHGLCDSNTWPDVDRDLCPRQSTNSCTVLVKNFYKYGTCDGYCGNVGRVCTAAFEEVDNKCVVEGSMECDYPLGSSDAEVRDALCECGGELPPPSPSSLRCAASDSCDEGMVCQCVTGSDKSRQLLFDSAIPAPECYCLPA